MTASSTTGYVIVQKFENKIGRFLELADCMPVIYPTLSEAKGDLPQYADGGLLEVTEAFICRLERVKP